MLEDSNAVRDVAERVLGGLGYTVRSFATPMALLAELKRGLEIELLVTDVMMPQMLGPEVVARVRGRLPELPVVYITGYADAELELDARTALLAKPFRPEQLAEQVAKLLALSD